MITGDCPYDDCDDFRMRLLPDVPLPKFSKEQCPACKRTIWVLYSRIDPEVYTESDFDRAWVVDEATKNIKRREDV
jgi:hypothetical protein